MADGDGTPEDRPQSPANTVVDNESHAEEPSRPFHLDLGDALTHSSECKRLGNNQCLAAGGHSDAPRREDNPFSFKHFLRGDTSTNYQNKGARPKVYCEGRAMPDMDPPKGPESAKQGRMAPEYPSALPDFVQDHLVVEQCFLSNSPGGYSLDLPDFTPNRDSVKVNRVNLDSSHNVISRRPDGTNDLSIPLDLPVRPQAGGFPLDLPIGSPTNTVRNCSNNEAGISKSLPDFLADGAVRTQNQADQVESPERESDRLRRELDLTRRQLHEQNRRAETLSRELEIARNKEHDYTQNLAKALEQVEENLERSNNARASAENTISKLKQEVKSLASQINLLKLENRALRGDEGAAGGHDYYSQSELHSQRLAQELKATASRAEQSLRQLLTGVDNLRIMAATLENMHRIEEKNDNSFLDLNEDTGPAL